MLITSNQNYVTANTTIIYTLIYDSSKGNYNYIILIIYFM